MSGKNKFFMTFISENDLFEWMDTYEWCPHEEIVIEKRWSAYSKTYFSKVADRRWKDVDRRCVFAEIKKKGALSFGDSVKFSEVSKLYVESEEHREILINRLGESVRIELAPPEVVEQWNRWLCKCIDVDSREEDRRHGMEEFPRLFKFSRENVKMVLDGWSDRKSPLVECLFAYSRHNPKLPTGICGAFMDLGIVVREMIGNSGESKPLAEYREFVVGIQSCGDDLCAAMSKLKEFKPDSQFFKPEYVLYLHWKYMCERAGDKILFEEIGNDVHSLVKSCPDLRESLIRGLCLIGRKAGFSEFARMYHVAARCSFRHIVSHLASNSITAPAEAR